MKRLTTPSTNLEAARWSSPRGAAEIGSLAAPDHGHHRHDDHGHGHACGGSGGRTAEKTCSGLCGCCERKARRAAEEQS